MYRWSYELNTRFALHCIAIISPGSLRANFTLALPSFLNRLNSNCTGPYCMEFYRRLSARLQYLHYVSKRTHDDVIKWKHFPRYWPFVRRIHRSPVNSSHKGQWRGALMFSLICIWMNGWENKGEAGGLICHRAHYDVIVMKYRAAIRQTINHASSW